MDNYFLSVDFVFVDALNDCAKNDDFSEYFDLLHERFLFGLFIDGECNAN